MAFAVSRRPRHLGMPLVACMLLLCACGGEPPEVMAVEARLELRPGDPSAYESLSAFASVRDLNGLDDIESIMIVHDESGLSWRLTDSNWTKRKEGAETWIGSAGLAMVQHDSLPRGEYRLVVVNLAGQKAERAFRMDADSKKARIPGLSVDSDTTTLDSAWPENYFLAYDAVGSLVSVKEAKPGKLGILALFGSALEKRIQTLAAYGYDPHRHLGAYSWRMKKK